MQNKNKGILTVYFVLGLESGIRDEVSDQDGKSLGWLPRIKLTDCVHRGLFKLRVEMISVNTVSSHVPCNKSRYSKAQIRHWQMYAFIFDITFAGGFDINLQE